MEFTRPNPTSLYSFLTPLPVNNAPPGMDQTPVTPPIPAMAGLDQALLPHLRSHEGASGQQTPSFLASPMESIAPPTNLMQAEGSELSPQLQSVDPTGVCSIAIVFLHSDQQESYVGQSCRYPWKNCGNPAS